MSTTAPQLTTTNRFAGANKAVRISVTTWFIVAVIGQWLFAYYVAAFYGGSLAIGEVERWNEVLSPGYQQDNPMGNLAVGIHLLLAVIIMVGGPLQFVPRIRAKAPVFHRWNGRVYVLTTMITGLTGLWMIWFHQEYDESVSSTAMTIEALFIVLAGGLVWRNAVARKMLRHERWAVRLFLVASGVWFFRIILMFWLIVNGGPVGFDVETFTGPFLDFLSFAHYLLPLAIYELYLVLKDHKLPLVRYALAGTFFLLTAATVVGVFAATVGMWLPML